MRDSRAREGRVGEGSDGSRARGEWAGGGDDDDGSARKCSGEGRGQRRESLNRFGGRGGGERGLREEERLHHLLQRLLQPQLFRFHRLQNVSGKHVSSHTLGITHYA